MNNKQAYLAMKYFLETFYERTGSDDVGELLGNMILIDDELTMDPAVWEDWMEAVEKAKEE